MRSIDKYAFQMIQRGQAISGKGLKTPLDKEHFKAKMLFLLTDVIIIKGNYFKD